MPGDVRVLRRSRSALDALVADVADAADVGRGSRIASRASRVWAGERVPDLFCAPWKSGSPSLLDFKLKLDVRRGAVGFAPPDLRASSDTFPSGLGEGHSPSPFLSLPGVDGFRPKMFGNALLARLALSSFFLNFSASSASSLWRSRSRSRSLRALSSGAFGGTYSFRGRGAKSRNPFMPPALLGLSGSNTGEVGSEGGINTSSPVATRRLIIPEAVAEKAEEKEGGDGASTNRRRRDAAASLC